MLPLLAHLHSSYILSMTGGQSHYIYHKNIFNQRLETLEIELRAGDVAQQVKVLAAWTW